MNYVHAPGDGCVFLLDVDNTLLDNDRFQRELRARIETGFGAAERTRYWDLFERLRETSGIADYLGVLQQFRAGIDDEPEILRLAGWILDYPFANLAYPHAFDAIAHLRTFGTTAVLSDGDVVLQPRKVKHSGVWEAVEGRVMIYVHKELELDSVQRRYAAVHYVMFDDKPRILAAMKAKMKNRLTTVFVRQGQYAFAADAGTYEPKPDRVIERIGDLISFKLSDFEVAQ